MLIKYLVVISKKNLFFAGFKLTTYSDCYGNSADNFIFSDICIIRLKLPCMVASLSQRLTADSFRSQSQIRSSHNRSLCHPIAATSLRKITTMSSSADTTSRKKELDKLVVGLTTKFSAVPHLPPSVVKDLQATGTPITLIDTRSNEEQDVSTIPGSLTMEEFERREKELSNTKIIAYCTIGFRSSQYAGELRKRGLDASNLEGSILAWTHEGLPLVTKDKTSGQEVPSKKVHVFGDQWKLQGEGYEPVTFKYGMLSYAKSAISSKFFKLFE